MSISDSEAITDISMPGIVLGGLFTGDPQCSLLSPGVGAPLPKESAPQLTPHLKEIHAVCVMHSDILKPAL